MEGRSGGIVAIRFANVLGESLKNIIEFLDCQTSLEDRRALLNYLGENGGKVP